MKRYTETHEWINLENHIATVGITQYAQSELGDIVYVELPKIGKEIVAGEEAAVLESTKAAADIYTPISGKIIAVNEVLVDQSDMINRSPESEGWIFKLEVKNPDEFENLMDEETYQSSIE